ncbi:MAG: Lrp/AsnC family transcriptional regulator [Ruminococcaceae bacterium]|nr:Lrp/AsnC family transcriptional regulator [Oscillospiraceae bacterium]
MDKLLKLLDTNARLTTAQMAAMLNTTVEDVEAKMAKLEQDGVVRAYKALIDWERTNREYVTAVIELRVTPKRDYGFEGIAETVMRFDEVESVYLMSGGYDLLVTVTGRTFKEVSMFVAKRLSTLDSVISTATHFVLRRYKESGVMFLGEQKDERGVF